MACSNCGCKSSNEVKKGEKVPVTGLLRFLMMMWFGVMGLSTLVIFLFTLIYMFGGVDLLQPKRMIVIGTATILMWLDFYCHSKKE